MEVVVQKNQPSDGVHAQIPGAVADIAFGKRVICILQTSPSHTKQPIAANPRRPGDVENKNDDRLDRPSEQDLPANSPLNPA